MTCWKDVKGYEGLYKVSDTGIVLSLKRPLRFREGHILSSCDDGRGYRHVCLHKDGKSKTISVHKLVANAFVPNPNGYREINHIDEDKTNNNAVNLEWCDRAYNIHYGTRTQKTSTPVAMYSRDMKYLGTFKSIRDACRKNNLRNPGNISNMLKGKCKTAYGYIWEEVTDYDIV